MTPVPGQPPSPLDPTVEAAAAEWLVLQDRGLTPAQQDEFLQWLAAHPAHRESFERHRQMWRQFNALSRWRPEHSTVPNPDLLARTRRPRRLAWMVPIGLAAAAAGLGFWWLQAPGPKASTPLAFEAAAYRQEVLPDGSVLDLNRGAHAVVQFSPGERRVLLAHGEAQFTVARDPRRPFIVRAAGVDVRAVGTAFHVKLAGASLEVLVTEGTVQVSQNRLPAEGAGAVTPPTPLAELVAGQRTIIAVAPEIAPPPVLPASPQEVERLLEWKPRLLDFDSTPLSEVVAEFNARNAVQLVIADESLRTLPIVATIRSDNVEGFVRLLEATMGVRAARQEADRIELRAARGPESR